ncbi:hypothetical protein NIES4071_61830 [Calothrix sp. NIES-4071]|nr:hypothetical protein NIES4071_61830 [Calothrix sp. NIES-4071]BAZ60487.1 hypothetical protein NIES4105_61780 [Calothrix sp. NIES-4105]
MTQLGNSLGEYILDQIDSQESDVYLASTVEDADFLAKGILTSLENRLSQVAFACFWNQRFSPFEIEDLKVAPIFKKYQEPTKGKVKYLIVVKSIISGACVVRTNLVNLIQKDDLYIETLINPESLNTKVEEVVSRVQQQLATAKESSAIYKTNEKLDTGAAQQLIDHPIPHWVERMTINYLKAHNGIAQKNKTWNLTLPTGEQLDNVVFTATEAATLPSATHLTLEDARIRGIVMAKTSFAQGQPIPCITISTLPADVNGFWSLWRLTIYTENWNQQRIMPLFLHDSGRVFLPTARYIWEQLLSVEVEIQK